MAWCDAGPDIWGCTDVLVSKRVIKGRVDNSISGGDRGGRSNAGPDVKRRWGVCQWVKGVLTIGVGVIVIVMVIMTYLGSRSVIIHLLQFLNEVIMTFGQIPIAPSILSAPFVTLFFVFVQARVGPLFVG